MFIERYHITGATYKSELSEVVQAKDTQGGGSQIVALKFCSNRERFLQQLAVARELQLSSEYVVSVLDSHDSDETHGNPVIVMPYGERNLGEAIAAEGFGGLTVEKIRSVAAQIAECLHVVHSHGIIHGDLPPQCYAAGSTCWHR